MNTDTTSTARTLVLGLGRQGGGVPTVEHLVRHGRTVRVADAASADSLASSLDRLADLPSGAIEFVIGQQPEADELLDGCDLVVVNPAIPDGHPVLARARELAVPCTQEVDLALDAFPGRVVLVTGTNGKSTVASVLAHVLEFAGVPTLLGGNIGRSLLADEAVWTRDTTAVVEISSYQLARLTTGGSRRVAGTVLTRMGSDHLERHGTIEAYHAAKARAVELADRFVVRLDDDPIAASFAARNGVRCRTAGTAASDLATTADGWIVDRTRATPRRLAHRDALAGIGDFYLANTALAAAAALELGVDPVDVARGLACAPMLPYRLQELRGPDDLRVFDNAVSTQIDSTASAITALCRDRRLDVWWVAGGKSKETDFGRIADQAVEAAGARLRGAALFGDDAHPLATALAARGVTTSVHVHATEALDAATRGARLGPHTGSDRPCLLFSPACASFDQWPNFRARAEAFHSWVQALRRRNHHENSSSTEPTLRHRASSS